jgi:Holliday junction resolvase RusA-like endonuclease
MATVRFTVPLVPPSVNHYVRHTNDGQHILTPEAIAFKDAVAIFSGGEHLAAKRYAVNLAIFLGKGQRGDIDNFPKCVLDGLKDYVIGSDAAVKRLLVDLDRDAHNPRTEIEVSTQWRPYAELIHFADLGWRCPSCGYFIDHTGTSSTAATTP